MYISIQGRSFPYCTFKVNYFESSIIARPAVANARYYSRLSLFQGRFKAGCAMVAAKYKTTATRLQAPPSPSPAQTSIFSTVAIFLSLPAREIRMSVVFLMPVSSVTMHSSLS